MNKLSFGCNYLKNMRRPFVWPYRKRRNSPYIFQVVASLPTKACSYKDIVWNPKFQSHKIEDLCLMLNCTSPSWLHVSSQVSQLSLLDDHLIVRKHHVRGWERGGGEVWITFHNGKKSRFTIHVS